MKTDSPTPPAPAEVCERLKKLIQWHQYRISHSGDAEFIESEQEDMATLTAALALIEQGEKERERLEADRELAELVRKSHALGCTDFPPEAEIRWLFELPMTDAQGRRFKLLAAREQPTPESK